MRIRLIINPGSTSTKLGIYDGLEKITEETIRHSEEELKDFDSVISQKEFRYEKIDQLLKSKTLSIDELEGVIAIGGLIKSGDAGVYEVTEDMIFDLTNGTYGMHASNLGGILAYEIGKKINKKAYVADPITTDEMHEVARVSGMPEINRLGRAHTLNQKRTAKKASEQLGKEYKDLKMIVCHLGGGISIVAHNEGRMIDTNNARGEGPFSMDRTGGLNAWTLAKMCFSGKYTKEEIFSKINGKGGVIAYLGTRDFREVEKMAKDGDEKADLVINALAYQISKEIGAMACVQFGETDAIVFTGGMAYSKTLIGLIEKRIKFIAPIMLFPGEDELGALAEYINDVIDGNEKAIEYCKE